MAVTNLFIINNSNNLTSLDDNTHQRYCHIRIYYTIFNLPLSVIVPG